MKRPNSRETQEKKCQLPLGNHWAEGKDVALFWKTGDLRGIPHWVWWYSLVPFPWSSPLCWQPEFYHQNISFYLQNIKMEYSSLGKITSPREKKTPGHWYQADPVTLQRCPLFNKHNPPNTHPQSHNHRIFNQLFIVFHSKIGIYIQDTTDIHGKPPHWNRETEADRKKNIFEGNIDNVGNMR